MCFLVVLLLCNEPGLSVLAMFLLDNTACDMHYFVCAALGSCAHVVGLERTAHGDLTTDMCIPAFKWTINAVLEAIERYTELHESKLDSNCSR